MTYTQEVAVEQKKSSMTALIAWAFYDWANSSFATVIQTFVFAAYFVNAVAADPATGAAAWGTVTGLSALVVALISPFLGAVADQGGARKLWLAAFTFICVIPTAFMWFVLPSPDYFWLGLWTVGIGAVGAEGAYIFYNSMLPELAPANQLGRWSGWGWGLGYTGGMAALILSMEMFINGSNSWIALPERKRNAHSCDVPIGGSLVYRLFAAIVYLYASLPFDR